MLPASAPGKKEVGVRRSRVYGGGYTMTSGTDERADPWMGRTASYAARITLLCWLLVLTVAVSAECAWLLWLQDLWTVAPTEASPRPRPSPGVRPAPGVD